MCHLEVVRLSSPNPDQHVASSEDVIFLEPFTCVLSITAGDNWTTARRVAEQVGIINVMAEALPAEKAEQVWSALHGDVAGFGKQP